MGASTRYLILAVGIIMSLHYILSFTHQEYGRMTSFSNIAAQVHGRPPNMHPVSDESPLHDTISGDSSSVRANATFVILARNSDADGTVRSIREIEDRFNKKFGYPYVLLNEEPFTETFMNRVTVLTDAKVEFGLIPKDHWFQPDWIDEEKAAEGRRKMEADGVIYGGSLPYRNMCRFNSGFFFKHPLLQKYRYYWRIEPDVHFHCDVHDDPFLFMQNNNKTYGFTITMYEFDKTIKTLWRTVQDFTKHHPEYVAQGNALNFMSSDGGETYNLCHFWSNFEIADMDFWRSKVYSEFFEYLDRTGGFYYERWGDAPVHSIAVALFAPKDQIHFFGDMGYEHNPYTHCPTNPDQWTKGKCSCDQSKTFDYDGYSCLSKWDAFNGR